MFSSAEIRLEVYFCCCHREKLEIFIIPELFICFGFVWGLKQTVADTGKLFLLAFWCTLCRRELLFFFFAWKPSSMTLIVFDFALSSLYRWENYIESPIWAHQQAKIAEIKLCLVKVLRILNTVFPLSFPPSKNNYIICNCFTNRVLSYCLIFMSKSGILSAEYVEFPEDYCLSKYTIFQLLMPIHMFLKYSLFLTNSISLKYV